MSFANEQIRQQCKDLLIQGKRPKEILVIVGAGVKSGDLGNLGLQMRKAGELKPVTNGQGKRKASTSKPKKLSKKQTGGGPKLKQLRDEFDHAVENEIVRIKEEIPRLEKLAIAYDKTMSDFAALIEKKIDAEKNRLTALQYFQKI